jgi:ParB family chromosome partitioning protein
MAKIAIEGAKRGTSFLVAPEILVIEEKLHGKRAAAPVSEEIVQSMLAKGWLPNKPAAVRKNGPSFELIDGCQRTKAAVEANKRRRAEGLVAIMAPVVIVKGDDVHALSVLAISNEMDLKDGPVERAKKVHALMEGLGHDKKQVAVLFGWKTTKTVDNHLALLDCAREVQDAVESGRVTMTDAIMKLVELPRDKQVEALAEMTSNGTHVDEAVERRGGKVGGKKKGVGRAVLKRLLVEKEDAFNAREKLLLRWIIGAASNGEVAEKFPELARVSR